MARSAAQREAAKTRQQRKRSRDKERNRLAAESLAAQQEVLAEHLVPSIRRNPVMDSSGRMIRGPLVAIINSRAVHADPIATCKSSLITEAHKHAARQLQQDWHDVGTGVGVGAIDWLRSGGGGGDGTGGHTSILEQIHARRRLDGAVTYLGAMAPSVARVVLDCVPISVWADEAGHSMTDALIWLAAALIRLSQFYAPAAPVHSGLGGIRVLAPARSEYSTGIEAAG